MLHQVEETERETLKEVETEKGEANSNENEIQFQPRLREDPLWGCK
jgi:hypothetical protein